MKLRIESAGRVASRVRIGVHELVFDQAVSVAGGEDRGPSALDVMVAAIGACAHYYAAAFLSARGISTDGLCVDIDSEKSKESPPRLARLAVTVAVPTGVPDRYLPVLERAVRHCPAYGTLINPPEVTLEIDRAQPEVQANTGEDV